MTRIFTRANFYYVAFKLRASIEIDIVEVIGSFGRRPGSAISLSGFDPDSSISFICRIKENLRPNSKVHFQLATIFTTNYNQRLLRILNYTITTTNDIITMYKNLDVDVLTKLTIQKSITLMSTLGFNAVRKELYNKLVSILYLYRDNNNSQPLELVLPEAIKYYPLYIASFFKKPVILFNFSF